MSVCFHKTLLPKLLPGWISHKCYSLSGLSWQGKNETKCETTPHQRLLFVGIVPREMFALLSINYMQWCSFLHSFFHSLCVCAWVCVHACLWLLLFVFIHVCMNMYISACMCACTREYVCMHVYTCVYYMCVYVSASCICVCVCACMSVCMFMWGECRCISNACM